MGLVLYRHCNCPCHWTAVLQCCLLVSAADHIHSLGEEGKIALAWSMEEGDLKLE